MSMKKALAALLFVFLLTTCDFGNYYAEYEGVNLIEDQPLDSTAWVVSDTVEPFISEGTNGTYMAFTSVSEVDAGIYPSGENTVFRLEAVNLLPNGDFEAALSADWISSGGIVIDDLNTANTISGLYSLYYDINDPSTDYLQYDLVNGLADSFLPLNYYSIRFDFRALLRSVFEFSANGLSAGYENIDADVGTIRSFPTSQNNFYITAQPSPAYFTIGSVDSEIAEVQEGYIDNLRITRSGIDLNISLALPYTDPLDLRPDLVSGKYTFSILVKNEIASQLTPSAPNRFPSDSITLKMNNAYAVHTVTSDWTRVSVQGFFQIDSPADPASTVITLSVTPMDTSYVDVGSLLIAAPELTFSPDQ